MKRSLAWLFALGLVTGCNQCSPNQLNDEDAGSSGGGNTNHRDASMGRPDANDVEEDAGHDPADAGQPDAAMAVHRTLTFTGTTPITAFFSTATNLSFNLKDSANQNVTGATIHFAQTGTGGALNVASVTTDGLGVGVVTFNAGTTAGQMTITASADFASDVSVVINVMQDPNAAIRFTLQSATTIPVVSAQSLFYTGATVPTCATLATATPLPTASFNANFTMLPATRTFPMLVVGQKVTVISFGTNALNQQFARSCTDNLTLAGGNNDITQTLQQDPTDFTGSYDVLLNVDLGQALPEPYESTVGTILDIFADPIGYIVYEAIKAVDNNLGTSFLYWDADNDGAEDDLATYEQSRYNSVFSTFNGVADSLIGVVMGNATIGPIYTRITTIGGDLRNAVTHFEIGANYDVTTTSMMPGHHVVENWADVIFTWHTGCPTGDEGCARRLINGGTRLAPVAAMYNAAIERSPPMMGETERFQLTPEGHVVVLRYGAVIELLLEEVVYPSITGDPETDTLGEVLASFINCTTVGEYIHNSTGAPASTAAGYCMNALNVLANNIEMRVINLTLSANPELVGKDSSGVTSDGRMFLVDADHDLKTELVRDVEMYVRWTDPNSPSTTQDVAAPITGHGRLQASDCAYDGVCPTGRVCQAIPHYAEVRQLERDCRRPTGSTVGLAACAMGSTCQSGLCVGATMGMMGFCYEPCTDVGQCPMASTCQADVGAVDLNSTRMGLGTATTQGCVSN